jgi:hypothetical protein
MMSSLLTAFSFVDMYSVGPDMSYSPNSTRRDAKSLKTKLKYKMLKRKEQHFTDDSNCRLSINLPGLAVGSCEHMAV